MKIVGVKFMGVGQEYSYIFDLSNDVAVGDYVVVDSPYNGFVTAKVCSVKTSLTGGKATKYVVDYVDVSAHNARIEAQKRAEGIKKALAKKLKAFQEAQCYQLLAQSDQEAAQLIEELNQINR